MKHYQFRAFMGNITYLLDYSETKRSLSNTCIQLYKVFP